MKKLEEFYQLKMESDKPEAFTKEIAIVVGLQPNEETKIWIFNGKVQMSSDGTLLEPSQSPLVWLADYVQDSVLHKNKLPTSKDASVVSPETSDSVDGLRALVEALSDVYSLPLFSCLEHSCLACTIRPCKMPAFKFLLQ